MSGLSFKAWELFDEFGADFTGILTYETEGAPKQITFGHRRWTEATIQKLTEERMIHKEQVNEEFKHHCKDGLAQVKNWGCKITSLREILDRKDKKEGREANHRNAKAVIRLGKVVFPAIHGLPPVPMFSPTSPICWDGGLGGVGAAPSVVSPHKSQASVADGGGSAVLGSGGLNAATLLAHTRSLQTAGGETSEPVKSPPSPHEDRASRVGSFAGSVARAQMTRGESFETASSAGEGAPPISMGPKARWEWKLRQLVYSSALRGDKKWGRERKTGMEYADAADAAGDGKIADALRIRCQRHEKLEGLAFGGFMNRPDYGALKDEMREINDFVDEWPLDAAIQVQKRDTKETCSTPGAATDNWESFSDKIVFWPCPSDPADAKWNPCNPKLHHMSATPEQKANLFMELFSEYACRPLISKGLDGEVELLTVLQRMDQLMHDQHNDLADEAYDDVFECVMTRIRGVAGLVSRKHGYLGSKVADCEFIRQEAEIGESSLYAALCKEDGYTERVAEYWRTVAHCDKVLPAVRKQTVAVSKIPAGAPALEHVAMFEAAVAMYVDHGPQVRPTQMDALKAAILNKLTMYSEGVGLQCHESEWIRGDVDKLLGLFEKCQKQFAGDLDDTQVLRQLQ